MVAVGTIKRLLPCPVRGIENRAYFRKKRKKQSKRKRKKIRKKTEKKRKKK